MNEEQWLAAAEPHPIALQGSKHLTERKARLFAVACCRRAWGLFSDVRSRRAVEVAESFADDPRGAQELTAAYYAANVALLATDSLNECDHASASLAAAVAYGAARHGCYLTRGAAAAVADTVADRDINAMAYKTARAEELAAQAALLRDVFGNPFRPVSFNAAWRTPAALSLAQAAYDVRILPSGELEPARLAVLADALEEAGCTDESTLSHLRSPGPHVRGCWALDLVLGKE